MVTRKVVAQRENISIDRSVDSTVYKTVYDVTTIFYVKGQDPEKSRKEDGSYRISPVGFLGGRGAGVRADAVCAGWRKVRVIVYKDGRREEKEVARAGLQPSGEYYPDKEVSVSTKEASGGSAEATGAVAMDWTNVWQKYQAGFDSPNALTEFAEKLRTYAEKAQTVLDAWKVIVDAGEAAATLYVTAAAAAVKVTIEAIAAWLDTWRLGAHVNCFDVPYNMLGRLSKKNAKNVEELRKALQVRTPDWRYPAYYTDEAAWSQAQSVGWLDAGNLGDAAIVPTYDGGAPGLKKYLLESINSEQFDFPRIPDGGSVAGITLVLGANTGAAYDTLVRAVRLVNAIVRLLDLPQLVKSWSEFSWCNMPKSAGMRDLRVQYDRRAGAMIKYNYNNTQAERAGRFTLRWQRGVTFGQYPYVGPSIFFKSGAVGEITYYDEPQHLGIWVTQDPAARNTDPETGAYKNKWVPLFEQGKPYIQIRPTTRKADETAPNDIAYDAKLIELDGPLDTYTYDIDLEWLHRRLTEAGNTPQGFDKSAESAAPTFYLCLKLRHEKETVGFSGVRTPSAPVKFLQGDTLTPLSDKLYPANLPEVRNTPEYRVPAGAGSNYPSYSTYPAHYVTLTAAPAAGEGPSKLQPNWEGGTLDSGLGKTLREASKELIRILDDTAKGTANAIHAIAENLRTTIQRIKDIVSALDDFAKTLKELSSFQALLYGRAFQYVVTPEQTGTVSEWTQGLLTTAPPRSGQAALVHEYNTSLSALPLQNPSDTCFGAFLVLDTVGVPASVVKAKMGLLCSLFGVPPPSENHPWGNWREGVWQRQPENFERLFGSAELAETDAAAAWKDLWVSSRDGLVGSLSTSPGGASSGALTLTPAPASTPFPGLGESEVSAISRGQKLDWNCPPMLPTELLTGTSDSFPPPEYPTDAYPVSGFTDDFRPIIKR